MADDTVPTPAPLPIPAPIMALDWKSIATQVYGVLKANVAGYLKDHADTEKLLVRWSEEIAKLLIKRIFTAPEQKAADDALIAIYKKAMKEELDAVTIDAEGLSRSTLGAVLDTTWQIFLQVAPILLKLALV